MTETSNFLGQMKGDRRVRALTLMASLIAASDECYVQSAVACVRPEYLELGIMDAAILCLLDGNTYLLTNDLPLYLSAVSQGHNAQYFDELRG